MSTEVELRELPGNEDAELRYIPEEGAAGKLSGYAAVFNSLSDDLGGFREVIRQGAFSESLRNKDDVLARGDHEAFLGRSSNGTLRLWEDQRGLRYEIDLPSTTAGHDYRELVRRGDYRGSSFAFKVRKGGETWRTEIEGPIRELTSVHLIDVAPVARPAYPTTDVALRSLEDWRSQTEATPPAEKQEETKPDEVSAEQMQANRNKLRLAQAKGAK